MIYYKLPLGVLLDGACLLHPFLVGIVAMGSLIHLGSIFYWYFYARFMKVCRWRIL